MEQEKFQEYVLQELQENRKFQEYVFQELQENRKFQEMVIRQLQALTEGQAKLEANLLKLETKIENQVIEKLRGLYDDREMQNDRLDRIERRLDKIEADTSYLVVRVAKLESIAK
ncbi:MAG: hypothetical protein K6U74_01650 [Firmicutes bacterium]|nr:hypothetical protein [Bacillota bacterium]